MSPVPTTHDPGPATVIPGVDPALNERILAGLETVDARLTEAVSSDEEFLAEAGGYLARAGGKRFRPLLALLCAEVAGGINARVVDAAVGVELTHLASLYHDDVMDEADLRRGVPSANRAYGNSTAILVGDLLFGTASYVVAGLGAEAVRIQAETFVRLCAGQIRDTRPPGEGEDPVDYYLGVLADKTGALIATAARYGALFAGADEETIRTLTAYGERIGVVFQLADDLLDIASDADDSGKTPGTDLREGKATLPVLLARASTDPADAELQQLLAGPIGDEADLERALTLLREHPAMEQAQRHTLEMAQGAEELLARLEDGPAVQALRAMVTGVALRST
ncbi:polyprenyl synthetase family protein [Ornithinicoccus hortensis]|uniref:Heptaprenyl diphosphate synthase n=1 Tax=Ornithinicoccus hortensis TaxID=82346 RepID=A0A542YPA0_9MICO|nr:polyprenyl synthetase family protein [Ornithinicoccus hortensis]TQL49933.1 heptaprenyl diphosphate synthase [Ornithinicoccus hortensis]